ncbi:MAG: hypothetical protein HY074_07180, partial [Deltaproteobacteria bacterium]|nr:hypothetical protein [Deltaproteobacteria bacterium]
MRKFLFLGLLTVLSTSAFAAESALTVSSSPTPMAPVQTMSATAAGTGSSALLDKIYLNYFAIYHGASLTDLGSTYALDRTGKVNTTQKQLLDGEMTAAYMIDKNVGIGPVVPFLMIPGPGQHMVLGDAGIKIFNRKTISGNGLNVYSNLIVQAPTSTASQDRNMTFALKTTPNVRYNVEHSNFALGAWTEAKAYLGVTKSKTFKLYAAPYVSYNLSDRFALNVEYEMEAHHYLGKPSLDFTNYQTDLQPGIIWFITPRVIFNP